MKYRAQSVLVTVLGAGLLAGCGANVLSMQELNQRAEKYDGTIVTVRGCFLKQAEQTLLHPCGERPGADNIIWVDDAEHVRSIEIITKRPQRKTEGPPARAAERKRMAALGTAPEGESVPVVVQGEFQAAAVGAFGRTYPRRLIIDRVLEMKE